MTHESNMVLHDEEMFFRIVQTTPAFGEALDLLRRAREAVLREKELALASKNGRHDQAYNRLLTRLASEIKYVNEVLDESNIRLAIKAIFGEEGFQRVWAYKKELERAARGDRAG